MQNGQPTSGAAALMLNIAEKLLKFRGRVIRLNKSCSSGSKLCKVSRSTLDGAFGPNVAEEIINFRNYKFKLLIFSICNYFQLFAVRFSHYFISLTNIFTTNIFYYLNT